MRKFFSLVLINLFLIISPAHAAKLVKINKAGKERLVLMPLRVAEEDKSLLGNMETALVQGLQQKYEVFSGEQVAQKAKAIFLKESKNTAKKECDETRCMQDIAEAFQAELIATANVTKRPDGYFLALSIQNIFDNKVVYSNSVACKSCDAYQVVDILKELSGSTAPAVAANTKLRLVIEEAKHPEIVPVMVHIPGKNYEMGKYEVTQAEWRSVMDNNPSRYSNCGDSCPVENVSWNDIQSYLIKLNLSTGKQYRLPSEDEWVYACYGGIKRSPYCGGDDFNAVSWGSVKSNKKTYPVGLKQANGYGLYDMSGNVAELTNECVSGNCLRRKVFDGTLFLDVFAMQSNDLDTRFHADGFRLARTLP